jgi:hypothetical protein
MTDFFKSPQSQCSAHEKAAFLKSPYGKSFFVLKNAEVGNNIIYRIIFLLIFSNSAELENIIVCKSIFFYSK